MSYSQLLPTDARWSLSANHEESLHRERQAVVRRLPLFVPQDGRQIWTGRLLNCQCSSRLFTLIGAPTIVVAEHYSCLRRDRKIPCQIGVGRPNDQNPILLA